MTVEEIQDQIDFHAGRIQSIPEMLLSCVTVLLVAVQKNREHRLEVARLEAERDKAKAHESFMRMVRAVG